MTGPNPELAGRFIVVSGNIGVGKSTLVKGLAGLIGSAAVPERHAENPYLQSFYEDSPRWAFHVQAGFLGLSLEDYEQARTSHGVVLERTLEEHHEVFARELHESGVLSAPEFEVLERLHRSAAGPTLPKPDLLLYLHAPPQVLSGRIAARNRSGESKVSLEYLQRLARHYEHFASRWDSSPLVAIDTVAVDVRRGEGLEEVEDRARQAIAEGKKE